MNLVGVRLSYGVVWLIRRIDIAHPRHKQVAGKQQGKLGPGEQDWRVVKGCVYRVKLGFVLRGSEWVRLADKPGTLPLDRVG